MVSTKSRPNPNPNPNPNPHKSSRIPADFKIYTAAASKIPSKNTSIMAAPGPSRKPAAVAAAPAARKALSDVSNARVYPLRSQVVGNGKPIKSSGIKSPRRSITNKESHRVSLAKGVVVANSALGKVKGKENMGKPDNSVRTGRTSLSATSNLNNEMNCQLRNRLSSTAKTMKDKLEGSNLLQGKSRIKIPPGPRVLVTRTAAVSNASSVKPLRIIPPQKRISLIKRTSITEKPAPSKSSEAEEVKVPGRSSCDGNVAAPHLGSGLEKFQTVSSCSSNENVTAIISRPKCRRRRSYTSSLMAGPKITGKYADLVKKDELPFIDDISNPLEVAEYVDDIYQYYWTMEALNPSLANYMTIQSEITPRMRGIMINWLIEVHSKFDLMQETLFLTVELLDRILSIVHIKKNDLQNVGLTTLLLASKYEDYWHPKIDELISISVNAFTREEMLAMEKVVLTQLRYRLNMPTPYVFMLRFLKASQSDKKLEHLAFYLIELCLSEYKALKFKPSLLCASAIYVSRCTLHVNPAWTALLCKHTRYEESQLRVCAELILRLQRAARLEPKNTTYVKFQRSDRCCVASIEALGSLPF